MKVVKVISDVLLFIALTIVTQVGGVVYLSTLLVNRLVKQRFEKRINSLVLSLIVFLVLYLCTTLLVVPVFARQFGKMKLPVWETRNVRPSNILTALLNRNYVRPQLYNAVFEVSQKLNEKYPGSTINYLDGCFPFFNKFRLFPHLGHSDGRKLDLSFQYNDAQTGKMTKEVPSFLGYGICEEPISGEINMPNQCAMSGGLQYSLLKEIVPQGNKDQFQFDNERNRRMINWFAENKSIATIYIEPHLKTRLGLTSSKIRFHGCKAVRHDDHVHIQIDW